MIRIATLALTIILMAGTAAWSGEFEGLDLSGGLSYSERAELASSGRSTEGRSVFLPWGLELERSRQFLETPKGSTQFSCIEQRQLPGREVCFIGPDWTGRIGETSYPYEVSLFYYQGRLYGFNLVFDSDDFSDVRRGVETELGSAESDSDSWYQPERSDEEHIQTELSWETANTEVTLVRRTQYDVTEGEVTAYYRPVADLVPGGIR